MRELLVPLPPGARVLDLGAGPGSFQTDRDDLCLVRLDWEIPRVIGSGFYVAADAGSLPFAPCSFDVIISNHSLEHIPNLDGAVREVGRVIKPGGVLYVTVPDWTTFTDRVYRWLTYGGGHINAFRSPQEVVALVESLTGLPHRATTVLSSSFPFLNIRNWKDPPPRRLALFAFGNERFLMVFTWLLRWSDRLFGTRLSRYGWSFYFGSVDRLDSAELWSNVCVRCGAGHPVKRLEETGAVRRILGVLHVYRCPHCGALNLLTPD